MKARRTAIGIVAAIAVAGAALLYSRQWTSYHDFEGRCLECHIREPAPGDEPRAFLQDISKMCVECHASEFELSHPVDMRPSMRVPLNLPLDWKGEVTCTTCHPVHMEGHGPFRLRSRAAGPGFCMLCHNDLESELHQFSLGSAHVTGSASLKYLPEEIGGVLDELSLRCMACHDALTGTDAVSEGREMGGALFHRSGLSGLSHPIGVSYIDARRRYRGAYNPVGKLPPEIKLFAGNVGCGSCHNPFSKLHNELVMSNEGSALCLSCHNK